jgi:hypothetical protein
MIFEECISRGHASDPTDIDAQIGGNKGHAGSISAKAAQ